MKKLLVLVDFQNDFIDGVLGTPEAMAIVPNVIKKVKEWDGDIWFTVDTHYNNYFETNEGKHLPVLHCIKDTIGWELHDGVANIVREKLTPHEFQGGTFLKNSFGSNRLAYNIKIEGYDYIEFIGLCTDICVVSNALIIKALYPEISAPILENKIKHIKEVDPDVVVMDCPGCMLQIKGGLDARGIDNIKVKHTAEILAEKRGLK